MKKILIISSTLLLLILSVIFGYVQYEENKQYESYISEVLVNDVASLSRNIIINDLVLDNILSEEAMTEAEISIVKENYLGIHKSGNAIVKLADMWLDRVDNEDLSHDYNPFPTYMSYNFYRYIDNLEQESMLENDVISLTEEDIEKLELMKEVSEIWVDAVLDNLEGTDIPSIENTEKLDLGETSNIRLGLVTDEYWDAYVGRIVNDEDWINMVEQMQRETEEYEIEVENLL